jgi:hypothetical protein
LLFHNTDEELESDIEYETSIDDNEQDSIDRSSENNDDNESATDLTNDAKNTGDDAKRVLERMEIRKLQDHLPTIEDNQHRLLNHVGYLNKLYTKRLIAAKAGLYELPSKLESTDSINIISAHHAYTPDEYPGSDNHTSMANVLVGGTSRH